MKKSIRQEKPHRLVLNRETVRILEEPKLLEQAQGGNALCSLTTSQTGGELSTGC